MWVLQQLTVQELSVSVTRPPICFIVDSAIDSFATKMVYAHFLGVTNFITVVFIYIQVLGCLSCYDSSQLISSFKCFLSSGWQIRCLAQFLLNPDSSTRALCSLLQAESSIREAGKTWVKKWPLYFPCIASLTVVGFFTCRECTTWDLPFEGSACHGFYHP
jgi:hypothetical protein